VSVEEVLQHWGDDEATVKAAAEKEERKNNSSRKKESSVQKEIDKDVESKQE
jgi:hypothetical protein